MPNKFQFKSISDTDVHKFYENFPHTKSFLQDKSFGNFRESIGEDILYYGLFDQKKLVATILIQKITTRIKTFLHCPHGPLIDPKRNDLWDFFLDQYKNLGRELKCDFVRISPLLNENKESQEKFSNAKFKPAAIHLVNPEHTWVLDLTQSEEDILKNMKKSTRYEVRRIEKAGIEVVKGTSPKDLEIFWELHTETVKRQGFVPFPKSHTQKEIDIFGSDIQIFSSSLDQKYYSSAIIIFDAHAAYYHQGSSRHHKMPVAHAPLWEAIKEAKARGCTEFNFWGVVEDDQKKHPWFGLSKFKKGFGGTPQKFMHCQDYPLTYKYHITRLIEQYRKWKRGY